MSADVVYMKVLKARFMNESERLKSEASHYMVKAKNKPSCPTMEENGAQLHALISAIVCRRIGETLENLVKDL